MDIKEVQVRVSVGTYKQLEDCNFSRRYEYFTLNYSEREILDMIHQSYIASHGVRSNETVEFTIDQIIVE